MSDNRTTDTTTDLESHTSNASIGKEKIKGFDSPVRIHIHSIRKRLTDADGVSGKAAIDGIVKAGLLQDDSPKYVKEVSYSQEKGLPEKTIITITEIKEIE